MLKIIFLLLTVELLSACSSYTPVYNNAAAEINAKLALAYLQQNAILQGVNKIRLAQKQAPDNPLVWDITGYFLETTGDITNAETAYLKAIQLAPQSGTTYNNYGVFLCRQKKYKAAITQFLLAINNPSYLEISNAYENAARCALKIPDLILANQYFQLAKNRSHVNPL